jgi:hypothetical protein
MIISSLSNGNAIDARDVCRLSLVALMDFETEEGGRDSKRNGKGVSENGTHR